MDITTNLQTSGDVVIEMQEVLDTDNDNDDVKDDTTVKVVGNEKITVCSSNPNLDGVICPICSECVSNPSVILACGHVLDEVCFKNFITYELTHDKTKILCPMCRAIIIEVEVQERANEQPITTTRTETESTEDAPTQPLTFRENAKMFLSTPFGRLVASMCIEGLIVTTIVVTAYLTSCNDAESCKTWRI